MRCELAAARARERPRRRSCSLGTAGAMVGATFQPFNGLLSACMVWFVMWAFAVGHFSRQPPQRDGGSTLAPDGPLRRLPQGKSAHGRLSWKALVLPW